jgi:hypothetical protein
MTPRTDVAHEVEALGALDLDALRSAWRMRYGAPPKLRSRELMRLLLAWRMQAEVLGGLDRDTRRKLARRGRVETEGLEFGIGARFVRSWRGTPVEVVVAEDGFRWNGRAFRSLSAAATAIAGTRWNGPRFFGLRTGNR